MLRRPPRSTLCPYPALLRSRGEGRGMPINVKEPRLCVASTPSTHKAPAPPYLFSSSLLPPPLLSEVCSHPAHLLQQVVPVGLGPRSLHELGQPAGRPLALLPQLGDALVHLGLLWGGWERNTDSMNVRSDPDLTTLWSFLCPREPHQFGLLHLFILGVLLGGLHA